MVTRKNFAVAGANEIVHCAGRNITSGDCHAASGKLADRMELFAIVARFQILARTLASPHHHSAVEVSEVHRHAVNRDRLLELELNPRPLAYWCGREQRAISVIAVGQLG